MASSAPGITRILIVDDSLTARTAIARILDAEPDCQVVGMAASAERALGQLSAVTADVILLDLEMPGMGGMAAIPKILEQGRGARVLVVSTLTLAGAEASLQALQQGAADTLAKPLPGGFDPAYRSALVAKVRALAADNPRGKVAEPAREYVPPPELRRRTSMACPEILAIGASTGGIRALGQLLDHLPNSRINIPLVVVQHLPESFMSVFARQLSESHGMEAVVATQGSPIRPGQIAIAPGNGHLTFRRKGESLIAEIATHKVTSGCRPSLDPTLSSLAELFGEKALAVVLSGMGRDGSEGAVDLVRAGGTIFVQDRASSAVWGMPGSIVQGGLASAVLPPQQLAMRISGMLAVNA